MLAAETQLVQALLSAVSGKESRKCHASSPDHGSLLWWRLIRSFVFCETGTFSASFGSMGQCRGTLLMCCGILLSPYASSFSTQETPRCPSAIHQDIYHGYRIWAEGGQETAGICVWTKWMTRQMFPPLFSLPCQWHRMAKASQSAPFELLQAQHPLLSVLSPHWKGIPELEGDSLWEHCPRDQWLPTSSALLHLLPYKAKSKEFCATYQN